jgi:hypothetical protein
MILGLQLIARTLDLSQDAALLLFFPEKTAKAKRHRVEKCNGKQLSVLSSQSSLGVQAVELRTEN